MSSKKTSTKKTAVKPNTIKVKFWVYMANQGDGSAVAHIFSSKVSAEKYAEHDDERFCDDIYSEELEVDMSGKLVTPDPVHWSTQ